MKQEEKMSFVDATEKEISDHEAGATGQSSTATLFPKKQEQSKESGPLKEKGNHTASCSNIKLVSMHTAVCKNGAIAIGRHILP